MENGKNTITRYQLLCLGFLALLSPIIRLLPQQVVAIAGAHAWLSGLLALLPTLLLLALVLRFLRSAQPSEGFGELFIRVLGRPLGISAIVLFTLWLLFYTAFALRSAADRYIACAYYNTSPAVFVVIMLLLALVPALGRFRALGRTAESLFPLLALVLIIVFAFSFGDVDPLMLYSPVAAYLPSLLEGVPLVANVFSLAVYIGFLEGRIENKASRKKTVMIWLGLMTAAVVLLCVLIVGCFGPELTARLNYPFFVMVRNISLFSFLERLDSVVLALWVISDFVLVSAMLFIVVSNLRLCFGYSQNSDAGEKTLSLKKGRWIIWLCAAALLALALLIAPDAKTLAMLSHRLVPTVNNAFTFGLLPLIIVIGLIRRKV